MTFSEALTSAQEKMGWSNAKVAAEVGVNEATVHRWKAEGFEPRLKQYLSLRANLPGFAKLMDRRAA